MDDEADYSSISSRTGDFPDAEARGPISRFGNGNSKPQSRFFGMNNFISQLLNNNKNQYHLLPTITSIIHQTSTSTVTTSSITTSTVSTAPITFTSTILQTQTSAITTPLVKLCLPTAQFTNNAAGNGYSTTPCPPRKRRGMNIEENSSISFVPNPVQPLVLHFLHLMHAYSSARGYYYFILSPPWMLKKNECRSLFNPPKMKELKISKLALPCKISIEILLNA